MTQSVGQELQNWLLRNRMSVIDPSFVSAVDLAFENAMRERLAADAANGPRALGGSVTISLGEPGVSRLNELLAAGTGSAHVVSDVYLEVKDSE